MARIKIQDLPKDMKISKDEMKNVMGGFDVISILTGTSKGLDSSGYEEVTTPKDTDQLTGELASIVREGGEAVTTATTMASGINSEVEKSSTFIPKK